MASEKELRALSKFLSLVLRHQPQTIGLTLDTQGWVPVDTLLRQLQAHGKPVDHTLLNEVVTTNAKKRFAFDETGSRIRANQGHSVGVDLAYQPVEPPSVLYHGTAEKVRAAILETGLHKRSRHHVHLSVERATAWQVGQRHGKPVIFRVDAAGMHRTGYRFFCSENGVWLTDHVPAAFLTLEPEGGS